MPTEPKVLSAWAWQGVGGVAHSSCSWDLFLPLSPTSIPQGKPQMSLSSLAFCHFVASAAQLVGCSPLLTVGAFDEKRAT